MFDNEFLSVTFFPFLSFSVQSNCSLIVDYTFFHLFMVELGKNKILLNVTS